MSKYFLISFLLLSTFTFADDRSDLESQTQTPSQSPKEIEAQLKSTFENQVLTIRHFYPGSKLEYDLEGNLPKGKPGDWISDGAIFVKKVSLHKDQLRIDGERAIAQFEMKNPKPLFVKSKDHVLITVSLPANFSAEKISTLLDRIIYKKDDDIAADLPLILRNFIERFRAAASSTTVATKTSDKQIYRVGDGIKAPKPLSISAPEYTPRAQSIRLEGVVILSLTLDEQGHLQDIELLKPMGLGLDENAIEAVSKWRFQPATKNGVPVPVMINVEVNFNLY